MACVFDVEELSDHGGSLRIYLVHGRARDAPRGGGSFPPVRCGGLTELVCSTPRSARSRRTKRKLLDLLIEARGRASRWSATARPEG